MTDECNGVYNSSKAVVGDLNSLIYGIYVHMFTPAAACS